MVALTACERVPADTHTPVAFAKVFLNEQKQADLCDSPLFCRRDGDIPKAAADTAFRKADHRNYHQLLFLRFFETNEIPIKKMLEHQ